MKEVRITCIRTNSGGNSTTTSGIIAYGWKDESTGESGIASRVGMVDWIRRGGKAYVVDISGEKVDCYIRMNDRISFLQSSPNSMGVDNLLSLNQCPLS